MWVKRKKLILAFLGSVLIHVLLLIIFAVVLALQPRAQANRPDKPIRLQIVHEAKKPELVAAAPPKAPRKKFNFSDRPETEPPPAETDVDSNKNSVARSELPPTGDAARPSQAGKERPVFGFDTHQYVAAAHPERPLPVATPAPETAPPLPQPDAQAPRTGGTPPPAAKPAATPTPSATPRPTAAPDEFALEAPTPTPQPQDFDPFVRAPQTEPPGPSPVMVAARQSRPLTSEEKTLIRGDLSNRGPSSLATRATPEGRYSKAVSEAISVRWYADIAQKMDLASFGTVKIHFSVDRRGKVVAPKVVSNSGNEALAAVSLQAIMDASIPPVPPEVAQTADGNGYPLDFDFSLY